MIAPEQFLIRLQDAGVEFFTGVPDSLLKELLTVLQVKLPPRQHVIAANEGGAVGLAVGYYLATSTVPVVYMQNSGLGNAVNPLTSLAHARVYGIPIVLLIGWRGEPDVHDEPQHRVMGEATLGLLSALGVDSAIVDGQSDCDQVVSWAVSGARQKKGPVALVFRKNVFSPASERIAHADSQLLNREEAIREVLKQLRGDEFVIATTGMAGRELYEMRSTHDHDFLNVGAMGHVSQIALGIALARPERQIVCLDGDGSLLMHLGALAIIGARNPANFRHIVLNNGVHDSVGGQPTDAGTTDFVEMAEICGYGFAASCDRAEHFGSAVQSLLEADGAGLLEVRIRPGCRKDLGRPPDEFIQQRDAFMAALGSRART